MATQDSDYVTETIRNTKDITIFSDSGIYYTLLHLLIHYKN